MSTDGRGALRNYEWWGTEILKDGKPTQKHKVMKFDVVITSFEVFCSDIWGVLLEIPF
jgi:hypothetical protein